MYCWNCGKEVAVKPLNGRVSRVFKCSECVNIIYSNNSYVRALFKSNIREDNGFVETGMRMYKNNVTTTYDSPSFKAFLSKLGCLMEVEECIAIHAKKM